MNEFAPGYEISHLSNESQVRMSHVACGQCVRLGMRGIRFFASAVCAAQVLCLVGHAAEVAFHNSSTLSNLVTNGSFEQATNGSLVGWQTNSPGFYIDSAGGRGGSQAAVCVKTNTSGQCKLSQTLILNRTNIMPLIVSAWSKAENVSGNLDADYAIEVDVYYTDSSRLPWQLADFHCGTHDWELRGMTIYPEKPVWLLRVSCWFFGHTGTAWFDDVTAQEVQYPSEAVFLQGVAVQPVQQSAPTGSTLTNSTQNGLKLSLCDNRVTSLKVDGNELTTNSPSGFLVRDVATNSDIYSFTRGQCPELGLTLDASVNALPDGLVLQGTVSDTTGQDRAITLMFALPIDATGWQWGDDIRKSRPISGTGEFSSCATVNCGALGTMSVYPLAAIYNNRVGLALALDASQPAQYRLVYNSGIKQFFIAYDFGLVKDTSHFPSAASFRFVLFRFDPAWGFRSAYQTFARLFPDYFVARSKDQGIWVCDTPIADIMGWQDFGIKYHEAENRVASDDTNNILSFKYIEPATWWMAMPTNIPPTIAGATAVRDQCAAGTNSFDRKLALACQVAAMQDETGQPALLYENAFGGAVWSLNPNPFLPGETNAATIYWSDAIKQSYYGTNFPGQLDGHFLDSIEGYITADLNFSRDHFIYTTVPLTFTSDTKRPALFKGLALFEFTKWISEPLHLMGKLTFGNGSPGHFSFICPMLDVLGTETTWTLNGTNSPPSDAQMCLWRTLAGQKPHLFLMKDNFNTFTTNFVDQYFQQSLFYGFFPSMNDDSSTGIRYFENPQRYNRDRPFFAKYIPLIRQVAQAGWQPLTYATTDNSNILVERFGPDTNGVMYFTLFNGTSQPQTGNVKLDAAIGADNSQPPLELISNQPTNWLNSSWNWTLPSQSAAVFRVRASVKPSPPTGLGVIGH
jgi:hypothetical protein